MNTTMKHKIRQTALALVFVSLLITAPRAQQPAPIEAPEDRVALYQALLDLTNPWTVMCIAAHPDDEDGTSLIVMRRKYGAHTVSLFSTFGEGGQNAIGPELYEELGAIRARETMAAAEIQGSEPHFLGLKDFGYSKSADEAFKFWGHDEALRRMVLQFRRLRPDVIITNHSATSNDHGHHQATARLELEAFDAAADPKRFPEQLSNDVTVWQVQRLFVRARGNAQAPPDSSPVVTIDPNEQDPVRGVVYAEEALHALQKHATQGPWPKTFAEFAARFRAFTGQSSAPGKLPLIRYRLVREAQNVPPVGSTARTFLAGLQPRTPIATWLDMLQVERRPLYDLLNEKDRVFDQLLAAYEKPPKIASDDIQSTEEWSLLKTKLSKALMLSSGLRIGVSSNTAIPKSDHVVSFDLRNVGSRSIMLKRVEGDPLTLSPNGSTIVTKHVRIPSDWTVNLPLYKHLYDGFTSGLIVQEYFRVTVDGHSSFVVSPATELDVAPAVEVVEVSPSPVALTVAKLAAHAPDPKEKLRFTIKLVNRQATAFDGELIAASGLTHERTDRIAVKLNAGESKSVTMMAQQPRDLGPHSTVDFMVQSANVNSPSQMVPVIYADARVAQNLSVGYVRGFDFSLPNALNALGVYSKELSVDEVKTADLQKYTSIIVDNRVYESQPELIAANQKLLDYANAGGTLIVFYHKSDEWNPDERRKRPQLAPYKLILGNERVTDETAPISFIEPEHPLLNSPNKLGQDDFANWIQERGLYYPKDWDPQFHALLQSNDPGEAPLKGGLLVADYGRGHYIYTSMVWYRELRAGVPGAYRMLANMISYGHSEK
jgi:LmbE family N-acetylglucosaminyl deacetylase